MMLFNCFCVSLGNVFVKFIVFLFVSTFACLGILVSWDIGRALMFLCYYVNCAIIMKSSASNNDISIG